MSKRFGRNQKRRLMAKVEVLGNSLDACQSQLVSARERSTTMGRMLNRVSECMGPSFIGLDPESYSLGRREGLPRSIRVNASEQRMLGAFDNQEIMRLTYMVKDIEIMTASAEWRNNPDQSKYMHFSIDHPVLGQVGYAATAEAIAQMGPSAIGIVSEQFATLLYNKAKEHIK